MIDLIGMDEYSTMVCLQPGDTKITASLEWESNDGCGLVPLGSDKCTLATLGLKWNLGEFENQDCNDVEESGKVTKFEVLSFNSFISTSNMIANHEVRVVNQEPIFWMTTSKKAIDSDK